MGKKTELIKSAKTKEEQQWLLKRFSRGESVDQALRGYKSGKPRGHVHTWQPGDTWESVSHDERQAFAAKISNNPSPEPGQQVYIPPKNSYISHGRMAFVRGEHSEDYKASLEDALGTLPPGAQEARYWGDIYFKPQRKPEGDGVTWDWAPTSSPTYQPGYWEDPKRVARWHQQIQNWKSAGVEIDESIDVDGIEAAYDYLSLANDDKPWYQWGYLPDGDPGRGLLSEIGIPDASLLPDDELDYAPPAQEITVGEVTDDEIAQYTEMFDLSEYQVNYLKDNGTLRLTEEQTELIRQQQEQAQGGQPPPVTLDEYWNYYNDPNVPWIEKVKSTLASSPVAGGAATGATLGFLAGGPAGILPGIAVGAGVGGISKKFPKVAELLMGLDALAEGGERVLGMLATGYGVAGEAIAEGKPLVGEDSASSEIAYLLNDLDAFWQAGHVAYDAGLVPTAPRAMWNALVTKKPVEVWDPFATEPRVLQPDEIGVHAVVDAFDRIKDMPESGETLEAIYQDMQYRFGTDGMTRELIGHIALDPLNLAGFAVTEPLQILARAQGWDNLSKAVSQVKTSGSIPRPTSIPGMYGNVLRQTMNVDEIADMGMVSRWLGDVVRTDSMVDSLRMNVLGVEDTGKIIDLQTARYADPGFVSKAAGAVTLGSPAAALGYGVLGPPGAVLGGLLYGIQGYKRGFSYLFRLTPAARAAEMVNNSSANVVSILDQARSDPDQAVKLIKMLGENRPELARALSMESINAAEGNAAAMALREFAPTADELLNSYKLVQDSGWVGMLEDLAEMTGRYGDELERMAKFGKSVDEIAADPRLSRMAMDRAVDSIVAELKRVEDANILFQQYTDAARMSGDDAAKAILEAMESGDLSPSVLQDMAKLFTEDYIPYSNRAFMSSLYDSAMHHASDWAAKWFGVQPENMFVRLGQTVKSAQSLVLLGWNPNYFINNVLNNLATSAAEGVFGLRLPGQIRRVWNRFSPDGLETLRMRSGVGMAGEDALRGAEGLDPIAEATRTDFQKSNFAQAMRNAKDKLAFTSNLSGKAESFQKAQATTSGVVQFMTRHWKRGVGFDRLPYQVEDALRSIDPDLPTQYYKAIESGWSPQEIDNMVWSTINKRTVDDMIPDAASTIGVDNVELNDAFHRTGVYDFLSERLGGQDYSYRTVRKAFEDLYKNVRDSLEEMSIRNAEYQANQTAVKTNTEGAYAAFEMVDQFSFDYAEQWMNHFVLMQQTAEEASQFTGPMAGLVWKKGFSITQDNWGRLNRKQQAQLLGMANGLGVDNAKGLALVDDYSAIQKSWQEFFTLRDDTMESVRMGEMTWDDYHGLMADEYEKTFANQEALFDKVDQHYSDVFALQFGDEIRGVVDRWREGIKEIRQKMHEDMANFRADGRKDWTSFLQGEYMEDILGLHLKNQEFAKSLYEQITGKPAPEGKAVDVPQLQDTDWKMGGSDISEGRRLQEAVQQASDMETNVAARASAIRKLAAEYDIPTAIDKNGNIIPLDYELLEDTVNAHIAGEFSGQAPDAPHWMTTSQFREFIEGIGDAEIEQLFNMGMPDDVSADTLHMYVIDQALENGMEVPKRILDLYPELWSKWQDGDLIVGYNRLEDVPYQTAVEALEARRRYYGAEGLDEAEKAARAQRIDATIKQWQEAAGVELPETKVGEEPPTAMGAVPGYADGLEAQSQAPFYELNEQGWQHMMLPALKELERMMVGPEATRAATLGGVDLPPALRQELTKHLSSVSGALGDVKLGAMRWAEHQAKRAMLDYQNRIGLDNYTETIFPYQFWYFRTVMNTMMRTIDRPFWTTTWARLRNMEKVTVEGMPSRLEGKIRIPNPFKASWAQGGIYVDPIHQIFPVEMLVRPWDMFAEDRNQEDRRTEYVITRWLADNKITHSEAQTALATREGRVWRDAVAQAKIEIDSEMSNPFDFMAAMTGPSLPVSIGYHLLKGQPEKISLLPATRLLQSLTSWTVPGGVNAEAWLRKASGLPGRGMYWDYYIDRELSNQVIMGQASLDEAMQSMLEKNGPAYIQALDTVGKQQATRSMMGALWLDFFPEGEYRQRALKDEFNEAIKNNTLPEFFDKYPEYEARLAAMNWGDPETRVRTFLRSAIWDWWVSEETPELHKKEFREQAGMLFEDAFLNKETRSYESIPTETLAEWAQSMNQYIPTQLEGVEDDFEFTQDEETVQMYRDYQEEREERFPNVLYTLQGMFFEIPPEKQGEFLDRFPMVTEYWDWKNITLAENPDLIPLVISEESKMFGAPPEVQKMYYQYKAAEAKHFPNVHDLWSQYWDAPESERGAFFRAHPELEEHIDWKDGVKETYPELVPFITSRDDIEEMAQEISGYDESIMELAESFAEQRSDKYPNWYAHERKYNSLPQSERASYLMKNPDYKRYRNWKDGWVSRYPEIEDALSGGTEPIDFTNWSPMVMQFISMYALSGEELSSGAAKLLEQKWIDEGQPYDSPQAWIDVQVVPSLLNEMSMPVP